MTHDFKAALGELPQGEDWKNMVGHEPSDYLYVYGDIIAEALRFMAQVQDGKLAVVPVEPTEEMLSEAANYWADYKNEPDINAAEKINARYTYREMLNVAPSVTERNRKENELCA